ncbi:hypothetical protein LOY64_19005 [Pseudomonas corrugata]|uniref:Uncharacterized protein n=1 Tax=Pseudomonas corrugata TaxID=47879 RepID=A0A3M3ELE9_9PSED|nr:hypothetical protein [Pseudomonas corrugata]AOE61138.1 hypothetical protein AXG94_04920 [Pseudomonas corrugata]MDU9032928.1 hypothetical protein [Pseudomonas corrugata]QTH12292.1 hypothetical protein C4C32_17010 [Pseudomonas corrugata]RMM50453.1 hypothetical protein ALQ77_00419 [Pseudomonas corrugata]UZD93419.1 hypothetical protein LOY64_19005 [Pseudomonas corrugata]
MHLPSDLQATLDAKGGLELPSHPDAWTRHLISQVASGLEQYRKRIEQLYFDGIGVKLHCGIYNESEARAFAALSSQVQPDKVAFIGISYGFVFNAACFATMMLSRSDMLKEVGSPEKEPQPNPISHMPSSMADSPFHPAQPACPIRKAFAAFLTVRFVESVFMHEVSHLVRGHLGLIQSLGGLNWSEGDDMPGHLAALTKQALEFDADGGAIEESFNYLFSVQHAFSIGHFKNADPAALRALEILYADGPSAAKYSFMGMYLPLRMFEHLHWERDLQNGSSHPHPPIRMLYLMFIYSLALVEALDLDMDSAKITVGEWARECEANYMALHGEKIDPSGIRSAWFSPEGGTYIDDIHNELERLAPELARHVIHMSVKPGGGSS